MPQLFQNNYSSQLESGLAAGGATLTLAGRGLREIGGGDFLLLTLENLASGEREIVKVVAYVTGSGICVCAIERAQEGTEAKDWPAGTLVEARLTAGSIETLAPLAPADSIEAFDFGLTAGYIKYKSGLLIQFGRYQIGINKTADIMFPVAYGGGYSLFLNYTDGNITSVGAKRSTGVTAVVDKISIEPLDWLTIGPYKSPFGNLP